MTKEMMEGILILAEKEIMLSKIVVWIKAKGLWEECKRDISFPNRETRQDESFYDVKVEPGKASL